jgi:hypothetical protein
MAIFLLEEGHPVAIRYRMKKHCKGHRITVVDGEKVHFIVAPVAHDYKRHFGFGILEGVTAVFGGAIGSVLAEPKVIGIGGPADDQEALCSDWEAVGDDIRAAVRQVDGEIEGEDAGYREHH